MHQTTHMGIHTNYVRPNVPETLTECSYVSRHNGVNTRHTEYSHCLSNYRHPYSAHMCTYIHTYMCTPITPLTVYEVSTMWVEQLVSHPLKVDGVRQS